MFLKRLRSHTRTHPAKHSTIIFVAGQQRPLSEAFGFYYRKILEFGRGLWMRPSRVRTPGLTNQAHLLRSGRARIDQRARSGFLFLNSRVAKMVCGTDGDTDANY